MCLVFSFFSQYKKPNFTQKFCRLLITVTYIECIVMCVYSTLLLYSIKLQQNNFSLEDNHHHFVNIVELFLVDKKILVKI